MIPDGSSCPEDSNSTDCLLRTLLQFLNEQHREEDAQTNWDPITFWFTVPVGLLATVFAVTMILQAVFAAAKGRRKTNERAIGRWSRKTKKGWSWSEMGFEVTARTPILRTGTLLEHVMARQSIFKGMDPDCNIETERNYALVAKHSKDMERQHWNNIPEILIFIGITDYTRSWFRSVSEDTSAAAWIGLFAEIGLDRAELNLVDMGNGLRSVTADYLPDDIVAAPAYAELGIIVSLLATTGVSFGAVDETSKYPTIVGRGFQFDFRQHPILGVVGAYSRHERKDKRTATPDLKAIRMALLNGNGIIYTAGGLLLARDESEYGPIYTTVHGSQWRLSSDPPSWSYFVWFNFSIPDRTTADSPEELAKIARVVQWAFDDKKLRVKEARNLEYRKAEQITKNKHKAEEAARMTAKLAQGRNQRHAMLKAQRAAEETALAEKIKAEASAALQAADLESKKPIKGYLLVLQLCLKLLHSPQKLRQWFFKFPIGLQKALRWVVLQQMKDVDKWLQDSGRDDVEFRAVVLCSTTLLLLHAEEMVNNVQDCGPVTNSSFCHFDGHDSGQATTHTANQPHCRHDTARCRHSKTLQALANLLKSFNLGENIYEALNPAYDREDDHDVVSPGPEIASGNEKLLHLHLFAEKARQHGRHLKHLTGFDFEEGSDVAGLYQLLDRLRAILVQNSASKRDWSSWDQDHAHRDQNTRDVDDVIIYRCLMVAFLFRTASDSTKILESGLWEHVVPLI
ncbi:hypothetical protein CGCSCA4_v000046 [Colletotrichum siamense]|uniref:Uncharacterized protein n=1 Tax=Colletotrichum siamense TaxID=690259 RepID=A0A9P5K7H9_COLSI|nr:hypothetical protein CGCSCA4_v000046 [Colletotrichum siamense]KAF4862023.1 hypothetical protein CGCSCA2_v003864 [Colletotrichum siamense]